MKTIGVLLLAFLLLLAALPLGMGMDDMGDCPSCAAGKGFSVGLCLAVLAGALALFLAALGRIRPLGSRTPRVLFASLLDRPPRLA